MSIRLREVDVSEFWTSIHRKCVASPYLKCVFRSSLTRTRVWMKGECFELPLRHVDMKVAAPDNGGGVQSRSARVCGVIARRYRVDRGWSSFFLCSGLRFGYCFIWRSRILRSLFLLIVGSLYFRSFWASRRCQKMIVTFIYRWKMTPAEELPLVNEEKLALTGSTETKRRAWKCLKYLLRIFALKILTRHVHCYEPSIPVFF